MLLRPEPPAGALPLLEAFLRHGNPDAAELVRERPSRIWLDQAGTVAEAKVAFLDRIRHGELVCWARHCYPAWGWSLVSALAWAQLEVGDWQRGTLIRVIVPPSWQHRSSRRVQRETAWQDARVVEHAPEEQKALGRNLGGRPPKPYKDEVIKETIKWLEYEGEQPQAVVIRHLGELISQRESDGGPSDSTLKSLANETLEKFHQRLPPLGRN